MATLAVLPSAACSSLSIVPSAFKLLIWIVNEAQTGSGFGAACCCCEMDAVERSRPELAQPHASAVAAMTNPTLPIETVVIAIPPSCTPATQRARILACAIYGCWVQAGVG